MADGRRGPFANQSLQGILSVIHHGKSVTLVEETLGRTTAELDEEFALWFRSRAAPGQQQDLVVLTSGAPLYTATTNVNIRTGPSTASERIGGLAAGESAAVFETFGDWIEIRFENGMSGYVYREYMAATGN